MNTNELHRAVLIGLFGSTEQLITHSERNNRFSKAILDTILRQQVRHGYRDRGLNHRILLDNRS